MARYRCGYLGVILGLLVVKCMSQDVVIPRKQGSENSTEEMDILHNNTEYWNTSTQLINNVTERTDSAIVSRTSTTSGLSSTDSTSNISSKDTDFSPFIRLDGTTSNDNTYVTKQENTTNRSMEPQSTPSTNFEQSSTVEFTIDNNSINEPSTNIPEFKDSLNTLTSMLPTAASSDSFYTISDVDENMSLLNRTTLSTNIKTTTNTETEATKSHNLLSSSDSTDNTFPNPTVTILTSANPSLSDTISDVFSSTVETDLAETSMHSAYSSESPVTTVRFGTTKLLSPFLNETESTRQFAEETSREPSATSRLDTVTTKSYEFTSEHQIDFENATDQITDGETAEPSKSTVPADSSSSYISNDSASEVFGHSTSFGITDVIRSTSSPSLILTSSADDNKNSTERVRFMTSSSVNTTNSPDGTIVTSTESDIGKTSLFSFSEDVSSTSKFEPSVSEFITEYNRSDIVSTASTLSPRNESITSAEKSSPPSLEVSTQSRQDLISSTISLPTISERNESSQSFETTQTYTSTSENGTTNRLSTVEETPSIRPFPGLSTLNTDPTVSDGLTTAWYHRKTDESSTPSSLGTTQDYFTSVADNASSPSSLNDSASEFTSTFSRFSTEQKPSSVRSTSRMLPLTTEPTSTDTSITWTHQTKNVSSTSSPFTTTESNSTDISDSTSSPSSLNDSASEFTSTFSRFSTDQKPSSVRSTSRMQPLTTEPTSTDTLSITWTHQTKNVSSTSSPFTTTDSKSTNISDSTPTTVSAYNDTLSEFVNTTSKFSTEEETSSILSSTSMSSLRTESTFPTAWTSLKITESSTPSSFETATQRYSTSAPYTESLSTTTMTTATPTEEVKRVDKCLANETVIGAVDTVTVFFSFSPISLKQEARDDGNYEIRFQQSALACFDAELHSLHNRKNENTLGTSSEDKNRHYDSKASIICASAFSPKKQAFSITFYVRESVNGSEKAIPTGIIAQSLRSCKSNIEKEVGLNITSIVENFLTVPTHEEESILQRHATLLISVSVVFGLLLIVGTAALVNFCCFRHSRHYDAEKKKFKQDMSASVEMGDMIPASEILNGEIGEKNILGLSNGSSAHLIKMEDDGWVVPFSEIPLEDKNPPDVQDTKL